MPLPEKYARKFGAGATGAKAVVKVLLNPRSTRESITEALDAATFYGRDGARTLHAFAVKIILKNQEQSIRDTSWYIPIVDAMAKVPSSTNLGTLHQWALVGGDPVLRGKAFKALSLLVANAAYEIPAGEGRNVHLSVSSMATHQGWNSLGDSILREDLAPTRNMTQRVLDDPKTPQSVRQEAETLMWWINAREEQDQKALARLRGEPAPEGTGVGGFGTPPPASPPPAP